MCYMSCVYRLTLRVIDRILSWEEHLTKLIETVELVEDVDSSDIPRAIGQRHGCEVSMSEILGRDFDEAHCQLLV